MSATPQKKKSKNNKLSVRYSPTRGTWSEQFAVQELKLGEINKAIPNAERNKLGVVVEGFNDISSSAESSNSEKTLQASPTHRISMYSNPLESNNLPNGDKIFYYSAKTLKQSILDTLSNVERAEARLTALLRRAQHQQPALTHNGGAIIRKSKTLKYKKK